MQKHKPFHIECKNGFEFILLQRFLFSIGCGWAGDGSKEVLLDGSGTYAKYLAEHGLTVVNCEIYNPDPDLNTLPDVQLKFTINDLPEIKKTLETPVYEVGDWVKLVDGLWKTYTELNGAVVQLVKKEGQEFITNLPFPKKHRSSTKKKFHVLWGLDKSVERLATPEEISNANLNIAIERFKKFYEEAMKIECACDCAYGVDSHVVTYYTKTGLSQENRDKLRKELLNWYNKKDDTVFADPLFKIIMSGAELNEILNKY